MLFLPYQPDGFSADERQRSGHDPQSLQAMALSELSEQQQALIADRARVWEVRRFCQVLPSVVKYIRGTEVGLTRVPSQPRAKHLGNDSDGALAALLRCIVIQTGVDLAMISLLDDHTQYFVSGANRANMYDAKVTLDSTQWYGCESVTHHGGLCERTITQQNSPGNMAIYEELDMAKLERTKDLPFVQGEIANFRHYAGIPLNPYNGPNIGTVFVFSSEPSEAGLSTANRSYMFEIASHITKHLEQAVEALEGRRVLKFNYGVASLLRMGSSLESPDRPPLEGQTGQQSLVSNLCTDSVLRLYKLAATLLYDAFEFDGVRIQELDRSGNYINKNPNWNGSNILAEHIGPEVQKPEHLSQALASRLLGLFPQGAVFQVLGKSGAVVAATSAGNVAPVIDPVISMELSKSFPKAEQIILMPLWDIFHEQNTGAVLAFANDQSRVYLGSTDLSSISAFCTTIMTQVRRLEAQAMDKIKSDFLGSVSHELRTPLHGMLSSLELLAGTPHNAHQHDLLEIARYSGSSLLDTIERILYFSNISSQARTPDETSANGSTGRLLHPSSLAQHQSTAALRNKDTVGIVAICEEVIQGEAQRLRLKKAVQPEPSQYVGQSASAADVRPEDPRRHPILVFDTNATWSCRLTAVASFRAVLTNLLNNALKFSQPITCVRISLEIDEASVTLSCIDTGKGVASDFLQYSIFDPFSQEDPATEGTGLGLSIVKETTTMLGGDIRVDSSGNQGSTFTATFPSSQLVLGPSEEASGASSLRSGTAELPELEVSLFAPSRRKTGDTVRDQRCAEMLSVSLLRSLSRWFKVKVTPWASTSTSAHPRLLFTLEEDVEDARQTCGDAFDNTKHVVLCPDVPTTLSPYTTPPEKATIIAGPVTISKLQDALARLLPEHISSSGFHTFPDQLSTVMGEEEGFIKVGEDINEYSKDDALGGTLAVSLSNLELDGKQQSYVEDDLPPGERMSKAIPCASPNMVYHDTTDDVQLNNGASPAQTKDPTEAEPNILLVDDNTVNLKVLNMYVRKCTSIPSTSASGGQEAIDAFNNAVAPNEEGQAPQPFDLIFLDLSMPQVSGFDVARQIRETEARLKCDRTYICALTGLVSRKDRNAAYASGVDNYLVRPAKLKDLQDVVEMWRNSQ